MLCAAIVAFAAFAMNSNGFPVQHVNLNDGGIWVTNDAVGAIGRFNKPIAQLDGVVTPPSEASSIDVLQNGALVAAWDRTAGRLYAVNVFQPAFAGAGVNVSATQVALGGSTLAVLGTNHSLRTTTLAATGGSLAAVAAGARPRAARLPANAAVAVAADNTVYVAGGGKLRRFPASDAGAPDISGIPLPANDPMQITTVGDTPVIADAATKTLYLPATGRQVELPRDDTSPTLMLQQSSPRGSIVAVATARALYSVNLATGQLTTLSTGHSGDVAAPVEVAGCIHAAWNVGTEGQYVRSCSGDLRAASTHQEFPLTSTSPSLVFRVNRGEVVLNDTTNGGVLLVDTTVINARPDWQQPRQPLKHRNPHRNVRVNQLRAPLIARPDIQGVRPGRTTVVHVLDNDSGPRGDLLAVTAVTRPDQPGVTVTIAPDAQTVLATVAGLSTDAHFVYTIDDGHGRTAQAKVTLVPRSPGQNRPPALRLHYQPPDLTVASGGSIAIPVISGWRDFDGDPLYVDGTHLTATTGTVTVNAAGVLSYTAPQVSSGLVATIHYAVSDGIAPAPTPAALTVHVLGASSTHLVPPTAEPDVAEAVVGRPLTLYPLANDLPGADPTAPQAELTLAGSVAAPSGAIVTTDISAGTVTFTAQRPGSFLLGYHAAFGAAPTSHADIRVQVSPASGSPKPPIAVPDLAVIHGQQTAVVDVIANDYDPQGWVLGVVGATSNDPAIHVAVVAQRWLRISSDDPRPHSSSTVTYTVSDGYRTATGTVSVTFVPAGSDQITVRDDSIVIRAGDSAAVPVLANDTSSTGLPLSLDEIAPTAAPAMHGLLASNQGNDVRVTAPASVSTEQETTVSYIATDVSGATATGHLQVTIEPAPSAAHPNQAPSPQNVSTRETAGNIVNIPIPTDGIDPDGDSTAVTAVTTPPSLGRIVSIGPSTIAYQSYPTSVGTDTFSYQVTDPYGATGTAQVQVGILPPSLPQPPIAVDETVNAPPGAALHLDLLANDYVAPGDHASVVPLAQTNSSLPAGVRLIGSFIYLRAPAHATDAPLDISYGITDGSSPASLGHLVVRAVVGAKLLPIARDDVAPAPRAGARSVTVNVLRNDDDPAGSRADLKITAVPAGVTIHGASLTIPVAKWPREAPYQITAPDGLTATAVVDVPGTATSAITLKRGARIAVKPRGTVTVPLGSVLTDAYGRPLRITTLDHLAASPPGDISVDAHQSGAFVVRVIGSYTGPGAVTVQVYDGTSLQDPHGHTATVTIPVQVGPDVPLLRCPQAAVPVNAGGSPQTFDIGQLCDVWVDTTATAPAPRYTVSWAKPAGGVSASVVDGTGLRLAAGAAVRPGTAGRLRIIPAGATTGGEVGVTVIPAPLPTGRPVTITGAQAGRRVTVDLAQYVSSPLAQPHIKVLSVTHPAGATVSSSGPTVAITPADTAHGIITVIASVTDVPGQGYRGIDVVITVQILGRPGPPGQPAATASNESIAVSFAPAAANGAPIDHYTVFTNGAPHVCAGSPCTVTGLQNNVTYDIYVTAHNSVGDGAPSGHTEAMPNQVPDQVAGLKTSPGDTQIGLSWQPAVVDGSPVTKYLAEISPAPQAGPSIRILGGSAISTTFTGLADGATYTFRVDAINIRGAGPWSSGVTDIPFGKPVTMPAPTASAAAVPDPQATRAVTVSWPPANANGRPITGYTVREYQSPTAAGQGALASTDPVPAGTAEQSFNVANNGNWYTYTVTATNQAGESAESPQSAAVQGAAPPDAPANLSAADHDSGSAAGYDGAIHVDFTVPQPNSAQLSSLEYGLDEPALSGQWGSPPAPGSSADESITGLTNGTSYVVYVRACNDAGLCGPWAGPSNQVDPYGPPGQPTVSAVASGTSINYSWGGGGGNGRDVSSYHVCFDGGSCIDTGAGTTSKSYGYSQTHTITAYAVDTAGQQSATASASATTAAAPMTVQVSQGPPRSVPGCQGTPPCYDVDITVSNAAPNTVLNYYCRDNGGQFWPAAAGVTTDIDWPEDDVVRSNGSGDASWQSQCDYGYWGSGHLQANVNGTYSP